MPPSPTTLTTLHNYQSRAWLAKQVHASRTAVILLILITMIGTIGYMLIEEWGFFDSLYMTVITLSTVGYQEVSPLSIEGRVFTGILIMVGMCVVVYSFSLIGRTAVEGELNRYRGITQMQKKVATLSGHTIVCGYGRLAKVIVPDLMANGIDVVVIDNEPISVAELQAHQIPFVEGSAEEDETLIAAGIERATTLITLLPSDADNVYVVLCARDLSSKVRIMARTEATSGEARLRRAGADQIIAPYTLSGKRVVQQLMHPYVSDFLAVATDRTGEELVLEQIVVEPDSAIAGLTLAETQIRQKTGVLIAASIGVDKKMSFNPGKDSVIEPGSTLIALGTRESVDKLSTILE